MLILQQPSHRSGWVLPLGPGQECISETGSKIGFHPLQEETRGSFFPFLGVFGAGAVSVLLFRFLEHDEIWTFEDGENII